VSTQTRAPFLRSEHRLIPHNEISRHDRRSSMLPAAPRHVGDLATERRPIQRIGEMIPRFTHRQFLVFCAHHAITANRAN
jgi:hypothetical protein